MSLTKDQEKLESEPKTRRILYRNNKNDIHSLTSRSKGGDSAGGGEESDEDCGGELHDYLLDCFDDRIMRKVDLQIEHFDRQTYALSLVGDVVIRHSLFGGINF
jgi:hypothetical protein